MGQPTDWGCRRNEERVGERALKNRTIEQIQANAKIEREES